MADGHVFISYPRDGGVGEKWAERIEDYLQKRDITCWRDEDVEPDQTWSKAIHDALRASVAVVCVISKGTLESAWVDRELTLARDPERGNAIPIVAARVEAGAKLPFHVINQPQLDLTNDPGAAFDRLERRLAELLGRGGNAHRQVEVEWLYALLNEIEHERLERLYTPLSAAQRRVETLANILPRAALPVSYRRVRRGFEQAKADQARTATEHVDDVRDALHGAGGKVRFAVLGEPGAGKTFSFWQVAVELALRAIDDVQLPLPVLVPLREWIEADEPLDRFVEAQMGRLAERRKSLRDEQRLALLLDGLNELPTTQREDKAAQIAAVLSDRRYPVAAVSCRERDFTGALRLDIDTLTIQALDPPRIHEFVGRYLAAGDPADGETRGEALFWHLAGGAAVHGAWTTWREAGLAADEFWSPDAAPPLEQLVDAKRWMLQRADRTRRAAMADARSLLKLAENPYLLTVMVGLYLEHGTDALAGERTDLFLRFVDDLLMREDDRHREANDHQPHPGREGAEDALGALAWHMQFNTQAVDDRRNVQLTVYRPAARQLLSDAQLEIAQSAGLVTAGDRVFFNHQLLQEYFTALGMRMRIESGDLLASELFPAASWWQRSGWEEATVLLAGLYRDEPECFVDWLWQAHPGLLTQAMEVNRLPNPAPGRLAEYRRSWLTRLEPDLEPAPEARLAVANALAYFALDNRAGVGLRDDGVPDIDWLEVPEGPFLYGEDKARRELPTFHTARYPVTNTQFQAFIDAGGYADDRWWKGLVGRLETPEPSGWQQPNRPKTNVSWYEALAFCRWSSDTLGIEVRLPTELEWEKAARGEDGRNYPWGDDYRSGYANVDETAAETGPHYLGQTTAVGLYPQGASPYGVMDLSGNVWEWCLNEHEGADRADPGGEAPRALRGGSWGSGPDGARAGYRLRLVPDYRYYNNGFRVLCVSPIPAGR